MKLIGSSLLCLSGLVSCFAASAASSYDQERLMFTVSIPGDVLNVTGDGPWSRLAGAAKDAIEVPPGQDWIPYLASLRAKETRFWQITAGTTLVKGGSLPGGSQGSPLWMQVSDSDLQMMRGADRILVMCPPTNTSSSPDVNQCLKPRTVEGNLLKMYHRGVWEQVAIERSSGAIKIASAKERNATEVATDAARLTTWQENDKLLAERAAIEAAKAKEAARQREIAEREFANARAGVSLACDTGQNILPERFSLNDVLVGCRMSNGQEIFIRVRDALRSGWMIANQLATPSQGAGGIPGYSINLILKKQ